MIHDLLMWVDVRLMIGCLLIFTAVILGIREAILDIREDRENRALIDDLKDQIKSERGRAGW